MAKKNKYVMQIKVTTYEDAEDYEIEVNMQGLDPQTFLDGVADAILSFKDDGEGMNALDISMFSMYFAETLMEKYVNTSEGIDVKSKKKNTNIKRIK